MTNITLIKLNTVHLYLNEKRILYLDILNSNYSKEESKTLLDYFKNFWILANEQNIKYYLIININNIGIYPLSFYLNLINYLNDLNDIFNKNLIAFAFICNDNSIMNILKPLYNFYTFVRPYKILNNIEDTLTYFNSI